MKFTKITLLLCFVPVILTSCLRDLEDGLNKLDQIDGVKWNPAFAAPLMSTRITLGGLLDQTPNNYIVIDGDNLIHVIYRGELVSMEAKDFAAIPPQKFDGTINLNAFQIAELQSTGSTSVDFQTIFKFGNDNMEIDSLLMKYCALVSQLSSTIQHDVSLTLDLPGITHNGVPFSVKWNLPYQSGGTTLNKTVQLGDHFFNLTQSGDKAYSQLLAKFKLEITEVPGNPASTSDAITFNTDFLYNEYQWLFGYVGEVDALPDGSDTMDFNIFNATNSGGTTGTFTLNDPRIRVIYHNSYGIPIEAQIAEFSTYRPKDGYTKLTGYPNPLVIPKPNKNQIGMTLSDSFELDKNNSNLPALLNGLPDKLIYGVGVRLNPPGTTERNFITYNSRITFEVDVDIPLYGSADGFVLEADEPLDLNFEDIEELESATLRMYTENEFPIDVKLQVYFIDSMGTVLDSLIEASPLILESPGIDGNGRITGKTSKTIDFVIPKDRLDRIRGTKTARVRGTLNTYKNGGNQPEVKFFSDYGIFVKLGVHAKGFLNSKFEDL